MVFESWGLGERRGGVGVGEVERAGKRSVRSVLGDEGWECVGGGSLPGGREMGIEGVGDMECSVCEMRLRRWLVDDRA